MQALLFYASFAAMTAGILVQQITFSLFVLFSILVGLFAGLSPNEVFLKERSKGGVFFIAIVVSAILAQVMRPSDEAVKFHWAFVSFWVVTPHLMRHMSLVMMHRFAVLISCVGLSYSVWWMLRPDEMAWAAKVGLGMYPRAQGLVSNPITNAETLVILACWTLARLTRTKLDRWEAGFLIFHLMASASIIIVSRVRSGILAMLVLLVLHVLMTRQARRWLLPAVAAMIVFSAFAIAVFGFNMASIEERFALMEFNWGLFTEHWIMGIGPDRFDDFKIEGEISGHPHNTLMGVAVETGVVGLLAYTLFMLHLTMQMVQLFRCEDTNPQLKWLRSALFSSFITYWVFGLFDYNFADTELLIAYGLQWSMLTAWAANHASAKETAS